MITSIKMNLVQIDIELGRIFTLNSRGYINTRESSTNEFKKTFDWSSKAEYVKTMVAFANNKGGFLIFGIEDKPKLPTGLLGSSFETRDPADISNYIKSVFLGDVSFETNTYEFDGKIFGYIYTREAITKPIVCNKNEGRDNVLKEGDIYYRNGACSKRIDGTTLSYLIENEREKERNRWIGLFERVGKIGVQNAGLLNLKSGEVSGEGGSFVIDEDLLPKLQFIKEGYFSETEGAPTLRLMGELTSSAKIVEREVDVNEKYKYGTKDVGKELGFMENNATSNAGSLIKYFNLNTEEYMREFRLYNTSKPTKRYSTDAINFLKGKLSEGLFSLDVNSIELKEIRKQARSL